jgi:hypothetical protein
MIKHQTTQLSDPQLLEAVGTAMYGSGWKNQVADLLGVDRRRINHWLHGDRPIPPGIWAELDAAMTIRTGEIDDGLRLLRTSGKIL